MTSVLERMPVENWKIQSGLSGKCERSNELPEPSHSTGKNIILKWQKCGKGCKTCKEGKGHGPYYYRIVWNPETKRQVWKYIGKKLS